MGTIAVGDIHGNSSALGDLLDQLSAQVDNDDTVVFLGDYIDRGPDAKACVAAILEFQRAVTAQIVCLRGNHEDWFLPTRADHRRHSWLLGMEALETIESYSPDAAQAIRDAAAAAGIELALSPTRLPYDLFFAAIPEAHLQFFDNLLSYFEDPGCICVHGGIDPRVPRLEDQSRETLMWGADGFPNEYTGTKPVVYGHWNNAEVDENGWPGPRIVGQMIGLDTIAHGVLTAMRLPDGQVFQSDRYPTGRLDSSNATVIRP